MQLEEREKSTVISRITVAIAATFTAEPVEESLSFWLSELDIPCKIEFAPYSQVFQQLLDPSSLLSHNQNGINAILLRMEDWERHEERAAVGQPLQPAVKHRIESNLRDFLRALKSRAQISATPQIVCLCPPSPAAAADANRQAFFQQMQERVKLELDSLTGTHLVTAEEVAASYPVAQYYDPHTDELGHIPYTPAYFTALGTSIARKIARLLAPPHKVILLDCDGTLWKGVCGEDGATGIEIDPPRQALQEFMVAQRDAGFAVCLCSKNSEPDVFEVFERRREMPLKREHLVSWRINWQPKSENIKSLAAELNLGPDSFILIDDSPIECAEVQANCPEVLTLQLPASPEEIPRFLQHVWAFDHLKVTEEDKKRTAHYQQNAQREKLLSEAPTLESFLESLNLKIQIAPMEPHQIARVSQLTLRTNQFNFTAVRRSESEIQQLSQSGLECITCNVKDRFGDYGLVGAIIFLADSDAIIADTFLLSCRALGRGVEHRMLAKLGEIALERGLGHVELSYIPTQKNQPALNFLESVAAPKKATQKENTPNSALSGPTDGNFRYRLPAEVAATARYKPAGALAQTPPPSPPEEGSGGKEQNPFASVEASPPAEPPASPEESFALDGIQGVEIPAPPPPWGERAEGRGENKSSNAGTFHLNPRTLIRIATELFDPEQILGAIECAKSARRKAPTQKRQKRQELAGAADRQCGDSAPRTPVERVLASTWAAVLGVERVGIEDNFFELGGHSLLLTQLISRVRETFQAELSMQSFFEAPTVAGIADRLERGESGLRHANTVAELLIMVSQLTEQEARARLEQKLAPAVPSAAVEGAGASAVAAPEPELPPEPSGGEMPALPSEPVAPAALGVEGSPILSLSGPHSTDAVAPKTYYRTGDIERVPIRQNSELVYSRTSRCSQILSADVGELLSLCRQFKTLDQHAADIGLARNLQHDSIEAIKSQLTRLVEAGFLISQEQLLFSGGSGGGLTNTLRCEGNISDEPAPKDALQALGCSIASVGILTCNRLEGLKRSLTSYIENSKQYGRTNDFVVMDDSASPQTRESYRRLLRELAAEYGVEIFYAGKEEKMTYAKALIEKGGLPAEVVNFALFDVESTGYSYGANRNAMQLHSAGDAIFTADDDTLCRLVPSPELSNGLTFSAGYSAADLWVFPNRQTALESVSFAEDDNLALHELMLGKTAGAIAATFGGKQQPITLWASDFNRADTPLQRRLQTGTGRVLVTFNGLIGDCAWGAPFGYWVAPFGYLLLTGSSRERLVRSESDYRAATTSRNILRVVSRPTISDETFCMNTFVGLDNRILLPPSMPVRRGQDLIFATTLGQCFPDACFGHLPWALLHEPVETRKFWPGEIFRTASGFDTAKLIVECVKSCSFGPGQTGAKQRLRALGTHLTELGSLPKADFEEFVRLQVWRTSSSFISQAEEQLQQCQESPAFWANDVKKYLDILCQSLTRDDYFVPLDLLAGRSTSEARELAQRLVLKFGQLLCWWPDMVEVAKKLRSQGQRLAIKEF
ncbi:HAD-IIIC family phosphatase [Kamptonema formosum]|uniref:HAD-IIIC family phosphatase n=1 Tax=Kamptonema formosum TaxID=331992 RepID=UPI0003643DFD|nr:HAD-IIIC family phosphatase [Oscillatoria sp. PCC 10802]